MFDVLMWALVAATLESSHRMARAAGPRALAALLTLDAVALFLLLVGAYAEPFWDRINREDGPVEWITVSAFVVAAVRMLRSDAAWWMRIAIAGGCILVAGEEISWGQRLVGFTPPDAFLEHNFQQELNVHNVLMDESNLGFELDSKYLVVLLAMGWGVVGPLLARVLPRLAPLVGAGWVLSPCLSVVAASLTYPIDFMGEAAEMILGLSFAVGVARPVGAPVALGVSAVLGMILAPLTAYVFYPGDEESKKQAVAELEILAGDFELAVTSKTTKKKRVHKRVYTSARDGYVKLDGGAWLEGQNLPENGAGRADRRGFGLDPWGSPYWVFWSDKGTLYLYSFGPNRQRDVDFDEGKDQAGDDVVRALQLGD